MEDRFRFRVFIPDKKHSKNGLTGMFKVHSLHLGTNKVIISSDYGNCSIKLENNILMQSTGRKDKNGKLIYEDDIVKFSQHFVGDYVAQEHTEVIEYDSGSYNDELCNTGFYDGPEWCEVIGNIHENPDWRKEIGT